MLYHQSLDQAELDIIVLLAMINFTNQYKNDDMVDKEKIMEAGDYVAYFMWEITNNYISNLISSPAIQPLVLQWHYELQQKYIFLRAPTLADPLAIV